MARIKAQIKNGELNVEQISMTINGHTVVIKNGNEISIDGYTSMLIHAQSIDVFTSGLQTARLLIIESNCDRDVRQTHPRGSCDIHEYRREY